MTLASLSTSSQKTYTSVRDSVLNRFPGTELLSFHLFEKLAANISGVVSIKDDFDYVLIARSTSMLADAYFLPTWLVELSFSPMVITS